LHGFFKPLVMFVLKECDQLEINSQNISMWQFQTLTETLHFQIRHFLDSWVKIYSMGRRMPLHLPATEFFFFFVFTSMCRTRNSHEIMWFSRKNNISLTGFPIVCRWWQQRSAIANNLRLTGGFVHNNCAISTFLTWWWLRKAPDEFSTIKKYILTALLIY
jgi:hypothetical protein